MKQFILILSFIACLILSACGNSIERDAKRLAELQCHAKSMSEKMMAGEPELSDLSATLSLAKEASELMKELEAKYTSAKEKKQLEAAIRKAMEFCE